MKPKRILPQILLAPPEKWITEKERINQRKLMELTLLVNYKPQMGDGTVNKC